MPKSSLGRWYGLAALVIVLDQLSKWAVLASLNYGDTVTVTPFFDWVFVFNRGAAFSFLADQPGWQRWFFTLLALGVSGWIAWMLRQHLAEQALLQVLRQLAAAHLQGRRAHVKGGQKLLAGQGGNAVMQGEEAVGLHAGRHGESFL